MTSQGTLAIGYHLNHKDTEYSVYPSNSSANSIGSTSVSDLELVSTLVTTSFITLSNSGTYGFE